LIILLVEGGTSTTKGRLVISVHDRRGGDAVGELAGLPRLVPGTTVNRLCGSGLETVIGVARAVAVGDASLCLAGGAASMSRAPWVLPKPVRGFPRDDETLHSTTLGWRLVNPRRQAHWTVALGEGAEILADEYGISRDEQDAFVLRSHQRAAEAWEAGVYTDEIGGLSLGGMVAM
jgi:acetyl-CoA acetyltransferase